MDSLNKTELLINNGKGCAYKPKPLHMVSPSLATRLNIRNFQHKNGNLLSDLCTSSDKLLLTT